MSSLIWGLVLSGMLSAQPASLREAGLNQKVFVENTSQGVAGLKPERGNERFEITPLERADVIVRQVFWGYLGVLMVFGGSTLMGSIDRHLGLEMLWIGIPVGFGLTTYSIYKTGINNNISGTWRSTALGGGLAYLLGFSIIYNITGEADYALGRAIILGMAGAIAGFHVSGVPDYKAANTELATSPPFRAISNYRTLRERSFRRTNQSYLLKIFMLRF